jgi:collagenase-like PrtC family protease
MSVTSVLARDTAIKTYKNMPKNLAPVFVDAVTITHPTTLTIIRAMMCRLRSFVSPDVHVTNKETKNVAIQTGAVIKSVTILLYFSSCTIVGKKY